MSVIGWLAQEMQNRRRRASSLCDLCDLCALCGLFESHFFHAWIELTTKSTKITKNDCKAGALCPFVKAKVMGSKINQMRVHARGFQIRTKIIWYASWFRKAA